VLIWIKLVGAALVLVSATLLGWQKASFYGERVGVLQDCRLGISYLCTNITYGSVLLPDALQQAGERLPFPSSRLFLVPAAILRKGEATVETAWGKGIAALGQVSSLKEEDCRLLETLGRGLGFGDTDHQQRQFMLMDQQLQQAVELAEKERQAGDRLWRYLGILGGLLLVIIFV